jgi:hypothetical protein
MPVGNESGLVGKTLMGHPHLPTGEAFVDAGVLQKPTWAKVIYRRWLPAYIIGADFKTKLNLLNASISLTKAADTELSSNEKAVKEFYEKRWGKKLTRQTLYARTEQLPNPDNRIEITAEKNAAGLHKMITYCVFGARDMMSIDATARLMADQFMKNKLGVMTIDKIQSF